MMQYLGFFLLALAVGAVIFAITRQLKMKKILAAPFRKTGEVASNPQAADAKGIISCEGKVEVAQPLLAPCSGKPCVYFEIKVERMWEKQEATENGTKTTKGTSNVQTHEQGAVFALNDGSGPVTIDAREKVNTDLTQSFQQTQNYSHGDLTFGQYHVHVPYSGGDSHTTGIRATEKILVADGTMFAMGKLAAGAITKQDGLLGKLLLSPKGRDKLVGTVKRNMILGYVGTALCLLPGAYLSAFAAPPAPDTCSVLKDATKDGSCTARVTDSAGQTFAWEVSQAGTYRVTVAGTGSNRNLKLWPHVTIRKGSEIVAEQSSDDEPAVLTGSFDKGKYSINIRDTDSSHLSRIKGGAGFKLDIQMTGAAKPKTDSKPVAAADDDDEDDSKTANAVAPKESAKAAAAPVPAKVDTKKSLVAPKKK